MAVSNQPTPQQFVFVDTNPIDTSHRIITTNIHGDTTASRIQEVQVVILLRKQGSNADYSNGIVLATHLKDEDCLIIEGNQVPMFLPIKAHGQIQFWQVNPNPELKTLFNEWAMAIQHATSLISSFANQLLKKHPFPLEVSDEEILAEDHDYHKAQLKKWLERLKELDSKYVEIKQNEFLAKSMSLVSKIQKNLQQHKRVWVLLSESRGRYMKAAKEMIEGVRLLYQSLEAAGTHYITLKFYDYALGPSNYSHSPERTGEGETQHEKDLAKLCEKLERKVPRFLPVSKQHEEIQRILDGKSWKTKPFHEAGQTMQFFLERALTWE